MSLNVRPQLCCDYLCLCVAVQPSPESLVPQNFHSPEQCQRDEAKGRVEECSATVSNRAIAISVPHRLLTRALRCWQQAAQEVFTRYSPEHRFDDVCLHCCLVGVKGSWTSVSNL